LRLQFPTNASELAAKKVHCCFVFVNLLVEGGYFESQALLKLPF
jgi:hypothetical protein